MSWSDSWMLPALIGGVCQLPSRRPLLQTRLWIPANDLRRPASRLYAIFLRNSFNIYCWLSSSAPTARPSYVMPGGGKKAVFPTLALHDHEKVRSAAKENEKMKKFHQSRGKSESKDSPEKEKSDAPPKTKSKTPTKSVPEVAPVHSTP